MSSRNLRSPLIVTLVVFTTAAHISTAGSGRPDATAVMINPAPAPLDADEEAGEALPALARLFNPAMALPIRDVWPVEMSYAWHDGGDLVARVERPGLPAEEVAVVPSRDLGRVDWSHLPHRTADGHAIRYYVDAPGDDEPSGPQGTSRWRQRFRAIAQPQGDATPPSASPYRPTQYVHAFWWNRAEGLLALQYWFYYPFNEWVNHHEGDWEHIQVIVKGPSRLVPGARFAPVGHHYFFHDFWSAPAEVQRFTGRDAREDHVMVYVGGNSDWLGQHGVQSGGSYPLPARYPAAAFNIRWLSPDEDTSRPARFLAASEFRLIVLPEPDRLDARRSPELSWLRLPFYVGQRSGFHNLPGTDDMCGRPPLQPAQRQEWLGPPPYPLWPGQITRGMDLPGAHPWPSSWVCVNPSDPGCQPLVTAAVSSRKS